MRIIKQSGDTEEFSRHKLRKSLMKTGAPLDIAEQITRKVEHEITEGSTTTEIYRKAFQELRHAKRSFAARYSLKKAIFGLGPSGYPFERLVGKLLEKDGYSVRIGEIVPGACVSHEVDVIAKMGNEEIFVEAKFHNRQGVKSDVQTALYVKARFDDIQNAGGGEKGLRYAWLITNTKFTQQAIQYAECVGMKIIGWDYPQERGLEDMIEQTELHPITCLTRLSGPQKRTLLENDVVLCREITSEILDRVGILKKAQEHIFQEITTLCSSSRE